MDKGPPSWTVGGYTVKSSPISNNVGGNIRFPEYDLKKWHNPVGKISLLLLDLLIPSKLPCSYSSSCCCSLLVRINVRKYTDVSFNESKLLSVMKSWWSVLRFTLRFISFLSLFKENFDAENQQDILPVTSDDAISEIQR